MSKRRRRVPKAASAKAPVPPPQEVVQTSNDHTHTDEGSAALAPTPALPTVDEAASKLAPFFTDNDYSTIDLMEGDPPKLQISKPWGDSSVSIVIDKDFDQVADVLNQLILPRTLSALWHRDLRKLEFIWTAFKLPSVWQEVFGRKFKFEHRGREHLCEFGPSSDRLMTVAEYTKPQTVSETMHRNLPSFTVLARARARGERHERLDQPRSFWVSNVDWNEEEVSDLIYHLNFYLRYFDGMSPIILVYPVQGEPQTPKRTRYIRGRFPSEIVSTTLDENLLSFWSFAEEGNPMLRFLLYYRILEYAAVHFIDANIRDELRKILLLPDARTNPSQAVENMVGAMNASKLSDAQRLQGLMRKVIDPALVWRDIKANIAFFSKDTCFEGGFTMKAVVSANDTEATFRSRGLENLADAFRKIRNALSHGKDQETAGVIRPTPKNLELFRPWVHLIATAAGEVVLYKDAT